MKDKRVKVRVENKRTIIIDRHDTTETKDAAGKVIMKKVEHFRYIWLDDGSGLTDDQVGEKYMPLAHKIGEEMWLVNDGGELVKVATCKS